MAELEKVVISAEGRGFETLQAKMAALSASANTLSQRTKRLSGSMASLNSQMRQQYKATTNLQDRYDQLIARSNKLNNASRALSKTARMLMFVVIGLAIEFAVVAASLMSVNAAFAAGNAIMKAYKWSMGGVAAGAAAVGAALSIAAAGQREFTAAQYAHTQKATPKFGSAMEHSMAALRNLTSDAELAVFGIENLNAAFASVSKNSQFTGKSQQVIRALRDFAAIGGNQGKNLAAIGEFVGLLQKEGKVTYKVTEAAKAIGPEFEKAFKKIKKGGGGVEEVFKSILSGDMSKAAGITGAADLMSGTLFGMFKKYATLIRSLFADIGTPLLAPAKDALKQIFNIIKNGIQRISPGLTQFGKGPFLDTIVSAIEKITDFTVKLFDKYLPQSEGMLTSIKNTYYEFKKMWQFITTSLDRLRDGGTIVIDMFAKPLKELFTSIGENVEHFSQLAVDNKDVFLEFGDRMAGVVDAVMDFAQKFKEAFTAALPTINRILSVVENVIRMLANLLGFVSQIPGGGELITGLAGYGILKGRRSAQLNAYHSGKTARGKFGSAAYGLQQMLGFGMYAGQNVSVIDPATGQVVLDPITGLPITGAQANTNAARKRLNAGKIGGRVFKGGRFGRLESALSFMGGQFNPMASTRAAMDEWNFFNENIVDTQTTKQVLTGYQPGATLNPKTGNWEMDVTSTTIKDNPNKLTGNKARLGRAKAAFRGGFSMGGALGGMALGAFAQSSMAPSFMRENSDMIQMGGMLMSVNPMLGMAAMGGGTLLNLARGKGARTGGGGALTGMAAGAAMGAFAGVPGIIVGSVLGGIVGFFGGKKAEKMVAKEAAKEVMHSNLRGITRSLIAGNTDGAKSLISSIGVKASNFQNMNIAEQDAYINSLRQTGVLTDTQAQRAKQHRRTFGTELASQAADLEVVGNATVSQFESIMNGLQGATGKSRDEIMDLAKAMNINLYEPTLRLTDAISGLGLQMDLTAKGLAASGTDMMLQSLRVFDEVDKAAAIRNAVDAAGRGIRSGGGGTKKEYEDFMSKNAEFLASKYPNSPLAQLYGMQDYLGPGGKAFQTGQQFEGLEGDFNRNGRASYNALVGRQASGLANLRGGGIMQLVAESGFEFVDGAAGFTGLTGQLEAMYKSKDPAKRAQAQALENYLASGVSLGSDPTQIAKTLSSFGIDIGALKTSTAGSLSDQLSTQQKELQKALVGAIGTGFDDKPDWWDGTPAWWGNAGTGTPDTSSPRARGVGDTVSSRLGRTMSRHNYFNSMLTGKRMVTSSWRNHSLGSPSSDHVTGNAYDLVGQNLGQYATMINKAGGFAEFHGAAGSRHLHVVPPSSPVGDTGTSRIGQKPPMAIQTPSDGPVTINVYATERQSEQEIARLVMNEITKAQRNYKERK